MEENDMTLDTMDGLLQALRQLRDHPKGHGTAVGDDMSVTKQKAAP